MQIDVNYVELKGGCLYIIPFNPYDMRGGIILMYRNIGLMIQQNIPNFLAVDYTILANQRMLKQQQQFCSTTRSPSQHFIFFAARCGHVPIVLGNFSPLL